MTVVRLARALRGRRSAGQWFTAVTRGREVELLAYGGVFLAALALRLVLLDAKPLHHDETSHAWIAWLLVSGEGYEYDPVFHGPVQFYLYSLGYLLLGVGDTAVRVAPVVVGAALTLLPWFLREQLGRIGALVAAALLAISPSYLYFSRFAREDIFVAAVTLALIVLVFRFLARPARWHPAAILGLLAASFATKETTYITVFVAGTFFALVASAQIARARRRGLPVRTAALVAAVRAPGGTAWAWGLTSFVLVFTVIFSTFLFHPQGLRDGLWDSIDYWLSQQPVNRGNQPWFFYLVVLPAYELPIVVLGLIGAVVSLVRPTLLRLFLVWHFAGSLAVYSWASERMPWLVLHPLLPLVLLAGVGAETIWRSSPRRAAHGLALAGAVVGLGVLAHGARAVVYDHPADPAELLAFTQNAPDVVPVRDAILALDDRTLAETGNHARVVVDDWGGTSWPWAWYLRDRPVTYVDMSGPVPAFDDVDVVLVTEVNRERMRPLLARFRGTRFHLRDWWVVDYGAASPLAVWRWFLERQAWSPKGSIDQWIYVRERMAPLRLPSVDRPRTSAGA